MNTDEIDNFIHSYVEKYADAFAASVNDAIRENETLYVTIFPEQMIDESAIAFSTLGASERVPTDGLPNILPEEFMQVDEIEGNETDITDPLAYVGNVYLQALLPLIVNPNPAKFRIEIGIHDGEYHSV